MKAQELRIGNLVYNRHGEIDEINYNSFSKFFHPTMYGNPSGYKPIPITEEILLKAGFEKINGKIDIFEKGRLRIWLGVRGQCLAYLIEEDTTSAHYIPTELIHLHQLQNLYFALTGEELEINLNTLQK